MFLYKIYRYDYVDFDQFKAAIVVANDEVQAARVHPEGGWVIDESNYLNKDGQKIYTTTWSNRVHVTLIGKCLIQDAKPGDVILTEFKAG